MRFDYIIFDFDGTLAETGQGIRNSVSYAMEQLGHPAPEREVLDKFIGPPLWTSFKEFCGLSETDAERAVELYRERYGPIGVFESEIYPGMAPLLRALKAKGVHLAVASGKPQKFLVRLVEFLGLSDCFDAVVGPELHNQSSDKRAQILACLPEGTDFQRVCMVGDRCFDIDAARALGIYSVAVGYGYGSKEEFAASAAECVVDTVAELSDFLLEGARPQGMMISFEGTDGCGKSTQMQRLADWLRIRGYEVVLSREPGGCPISERIREVILSLDSTGMSAECEALLYAAARIEHVREVLIPALNAGKIVLCDRFLDSSIAYQAYGRELGEDFVRLINKSAAQAVQPDCTLQFDIDRASAKARMAHGAPLDRLEIETDAFFARVAAGYKAIADAEPMRIHRIDSGRDIDTVFSDVLNIVQKILKENG